MAARRLPSRLSRRAKARARFGWARSERATVGLAVVALDGAALLLALRAVYGTRGGLLSVQLSLGATAILSIAILTQRMLRRGERQQEQEGLIPPAGDHLAPAVQ